MEYRINFDAFIKHTGPWRFIGKKILSLFFIAVTILAGLLVIGITLDLVFHVEKELIANAIGIPAIFIIFVFLTMVCVQPILINIRNNRKTFSNFAKKNNFEYFPQKNINADVRLLTSTKLNASRNTSHAITGKYGQRVFSLETITFTHLGLLSNGVYSYGCVSVGLTNPLLPHVVLKSKSDVNQVWQKSNAIPIKSPVLANHFDAFIIPQNPNDTPFTPSQQLIDFANTVAQQGNISIELTGNQAHFILPDGFNMTPDGMAGVFRLIKLTDILDPPGAK